MKKISLKYLNKIRACDDALIWFKRIYGDIEYTVDELIQFTNENLDRLEVYRTDPTIIWEPIDVEPPLYWVEWLIIHSKFCQTKEMIDFYLGLKKPIPGQLFGLICNCKILRTEEFVQRYLDMEPYYLDVGFLRNTLHERHFLLGTSFKLQKIKKMLDTYYTHTKIHGHKTKDKYLNRI